MIASKILRYYITTNDTMAMNDYKMYWLMYHAVIIYIQIKESISRKQTTKEKMKRKIKYTRTSNLTIIKLIVSNRTQS